VRPDPVTVFGESAYADGTTLDRLAEAGHTVFAKVPPVRNAKATPRTSFASAPTPARSIARPGTPYPSGRGAAEAWPASPRSARTARSARPPQAARSGRVITIHLHEVRLQQAKTAKRDPGPAWGWAC
jgi:hypothetical protein